MRCARALDRYFKHGFSIFFFSYNFFVNFRAALDAVSFQTREILESMEADSKYDLTSLLVDGGDFF